MWLLDCLFMLCALVGIGFFKAKAWHWGAGLTGILLVLATVGSITWLNWLLFAFIFGSLFALLNIPMLRQTILSFPLYERMRVKMPAMSQTERDAVEAGDVWWEGALFSGKANWQSLLEMKKNELTSEELAFINNQVETLCDMLDEWKSMTEHKDLPSEAWNYIKQERFLGMIIPKQYGGHGFSALAHSTIIMKIATRSISAAISVMVPNALGPSELLMKYGTDKQKDYYLQRLANGEEIPCFALTGLDAGSDAGSITDYGIVCRQDFDGEETLGIRLNWNKRYITLAPISTVLGLAFKLFDPDGLLGDQESIGITVCLIPTNTPGVKIGNRHHPMHMAFMNGPTQGEDVFVPMDWVVGGQENIGRGWRMLMESLSEGRGISLPALSAATARLCYRSTGAYAHIREQFNLPIGKFEGIQEALAEIAGFTYINEATRQMTVQAVDDGYRPAIASAVAKYHTTEFSRQMLNHAMDVHGGRALQTGPMNYLSAAYMANPIGITVEGANILTRNLIIFGQGAFRAHPYLREELELLTVEDKNEGMREFDKVLMRHTRYTFRNLCRSVVIGVLGRLAVTTKLEGMQELFTKIERRCALLSFVSDISLMVLAGALKRKERISARLGDVMSNLYLSSAVIKFYQDSERSPIDKKHAQWALQYLLYKTDLALQGFLDNFKPRWIAAALRLICFPFGRRCKRPGDHLDSELAEIMLNPSDFRNRLTEHMYVNESDDDAIGLMENTLQTLSKASPIIVNLKAAKKDGRLPKEGDFETIMESALTQKIISNEEYELMKQYESRRLRAISVDDFTKQQIQSL